MTDNNAVTYLERKALRTHQVRRQKNVVYAIAVAIVVLLIIFVCIKINTTPNKAQASINGEYVYKSITITAGDSIWSIAEDNAHNYTGTTTSYVKEILRVNQLSSEEIKAGNQLIIPVFVSSENINNY